MLHAPVLQLDAERMQDIDPRNVESLFGMWTVFNRCASTIPDGKRLENLSWRIWARETLCCPPQPEKTIVPAIDIPLPPPAQDVPSLSNSLDSSDSDGACLSSSSSQTSQDFAEASALGKSRGKEPHLTPDALRKMVVTIQERRDPSEPLSPTIEAVVEARLSPTLGPKQRQSPVSDRSEQPSHPYSTESSCISTANTVTTNGTQRASEHRDSDTSVSSDGLIRSGSVVHGFVSPLSSVRSKTSMLKSSPVATKKMPSSSLAPQKSAKFMLGGSSEDEGSSFGSRIGSLSSYKKMALEPRKSSLSHTLSKDSTSQQKKKTTSFRDIVEQRRVQEGSENDEGAIASSDEEDDDDADDSVIDDDDEGEWEDSITDDEKPLTSKDFKRIDSSANLTSRRSILTAGLTEGDRAQGMLNAASKSMSAIHRPAHVPNNPVKQGSPEKDDDDGGIMMQAPPGSKPMPILASAPSNYAMAHSPRTTRRHMLSSELTESLRKNLLWERQQKNTTVNAFLKREARSMANLQRAGAVSNSQPQLQQQSQPLIQLQPPIQAQQVQPGRDLPDGDPRHHSWNNEYFNVANEYHTKGW